MAFLLFLFVILITIGPARGCVGWTMTDMDMFANPFCGTLFCKPSQLLEVWKTDSFSMSIPSVCTFPLPSDS